MQNCSVITSNFIEIETKNEDFFVDGNVQFTIVPKDGILFQNIVLLTIF
jgi:hypothetical protein